MPHAGRLSSPTESPRSSKFCPHVKGSENPADLISRGTSPLQLQDSELWWAGPHWLRENHPNVNEDASTSEALQDTLENVEIEERKKSQTCNVVDHAPQPLQDLIDKYSSITKIERVLAYCLRYLTNLKKVQNERVLGPLSTAELKEAHLRLIKHVQRTHFREEIAELKRQRELKSSSILIQLRPFLDAHGILRVGGRLQHSSLSFERKHPIVLPAEDRFTKLLFLREHQRLLHASQMLLLSSIREFYWPLKGRDLARKTCHDCVRCTKNNPRPLSQIMGALPKDRLSPSRPFTATGVDFAGPITTLVNKGRGRKTNKSYIALFICFSTKAIHLEATSELTTAAYLATLRRFIGRRGLPRTLYSDNGTNFVGANRELREIYEFAQIQMEGSIGNELYNQGVEWKFLPPNTPHMGGLWESGVKSCKYHLKRVMGNSLFTFEELATVLVQIEACLNSRPLSPMSVDPTDLQPLTPAHFLIGASLTGLPDADVTDLNINRLDRWQLIQRVTQDFLKRWAAEYVPNLQGRTKWKRTQENLQINELVVLQEENLSPLKWKLGRVVDLHPGNDGHVRVVTVRTAGGHFKRAIAKICKLPVSSNN